MSIFIELLKHIESIYPEYDPFPIDDRHPIIKIYGLILTYEEVEFLMKLTDCYISPLQFSYENDLECDDAESMLNSLSNKGVVFSKEINGVLHYRLMQFFPEMADALIAKGLDINISNYIKEYVEGLNQKPISDFRELPINQKINFELQHISFEEVMLYLDKTDSYALTDCLCRSMNLLNGHSCGHPIEDMCIQTGSYAEYFVRTGRARSASRQEVEEVLRQAEMCGLYHEIFMYDNSNENTFICNCCSCGCISMKLSGRLTKVLNVNKNIVANIDVEKCIGCHECIAHCPDQALVWSQNEGKPVVRAEECFSCGMCVVVCRQQAITLEP